MRIMSIDLGKVRTGVAVCDDKEILASPLCVITERDRDKLIEKISDIIKEYTIQEIVVGLPKNMNGSEGESAQNAKIFANQLEEVSKIKIVLRDERNTTISAHTYLNVNNVRGKRRKSIVDCVAATIILQDYLDFRRNNNV